MIKEEFSEIKQLLSNPKRIVIVAHKNPDGDAIGASLGLYHYLKQYQHEVTVILPNDYPDFLKWVPGENHILKYETNVSPSNTLIEQAELLFTLDFNTLHRAGNMEAVLAKTKAIKVLIDHHQKPDNYANYTYSDVTMSSTCEMVYHFIKQLDGIDTIDANMATALYLGIMTDTGSFRFQSTTSTTHRVIADLIDKGANNTNIHNSVYDNNSYSRLQLLGKALSNLKLFTEYNTAYISLSQEELNTFNFKKGDTEGIVNYALSVKNIRFAAIFIEHKQEGIIKISFRSKGTFDVNQFARNNFNGGGHINAAGGKSDLDLNSTIEKFVNTLPHYEPKLNS